MNRYVIPVLLLLLSFGVYVQYIDPFYGAIAAGNTKIAEYDKLLADAKKANDKLNDLRKTQESFPPGYDTNLATILPEKVDPLRLVIDINGVAERLGLHIKDPKVEQLASGAKKGTQPEETTLTFTVSAPYDVFRSFLRDLESDLSIQDMGRLSFSSLPKSEEAAYLSPELRTYDYEVSLVTYSMPTSK